MIRAIKVKNQIFILFFPQKSLCQVFLTFRKYTILFYYSNLANIYLLKLLEMHPEWFKVFFKLDLLQNSGTALVGLVLRT